MNFVLLALFQACRPLPSTSNYLKFWWRISNRMASEYAVVERGTPFTNTYRVFFKRGEDLVSPWHDIPLFADQANKVYNMVCEIPRWTNAKMEIATKEPLNPIRQDVKKGKMRFVDNCFPHHGYIWNYGALPQTWEDPRHVDEHTQARGDNDPIDVCEIGSRVAKRGEVLQVKVLGVIALIDEGETDWKVMAIDIRDPLAKDLKDIADVERLCHGYLMASHEWFKMYKIPSGKPPNEFGFDGRFQSRAFAERVINETHGFWKKLVHGGGHGDLWCGPCDKDDTARIVDRCEPLAPPIALDQAVDKWHFIRLHDD